MVIAVQTHEEYPEDIKFLCTSEAVSKHWRNGAITMVCYPIVLEIFRCLKGIEKSCILIKHQE